MWTLIITLMIFSNQSYPVAGSVTSVSGFSDEDVCLNSGKTWLAQVNSVKSRGNDEIGLVTCVYTPKR